MDGTKRGWPEAARHGAVEIGLYLQATKITETQTRRLTGSPLRSSSWQGAAANLRNSGAIT